MHLHPFFLSPSRRTFLLAAFIFIVAALCYGQYGFRGKLDRDQANHLYAAQRMAEGVPPYVSIFNQKTPLSTMMAGGAVIAANTFGWDDIHAVRVFFFLISCATVVAIFLLAEYVFASERIGWLAAGTFLYFLDFAISASSGPQPKTPTMLFAILALLSMSWRNWFWAGVWSSCAFLSWQPTLIFLLVALALVFFHSDEAAKRRRKLSSLLLGFGVPLVAVSGYFLYHSALYDFVDGSILFNLFQLDRGSDSYLEPLRALARTIWQAYKPARIPILLGFAVTSFLCAKQVWEYFSRRNRSSTYSQPASTLAQRLSPLLFSFPCFLLFSAIDFQGAPDLYVLLPCAALGFAMLVDGAIRRAEVVPALFSASRYLHWAGPTFFVASAIFAGTHVRREREHGLDEQRKSLSQIIQQHGAQAKYISLGSPEFMVISHRVNPNRYLFIINGIDRHIEAQTPGGIEGWLHQVEVFHPDVIAFGPTTGRYADTIIRWLDAHYQKQRVETWEICVRKRLSQ